MSSFQVCYVFKKFWDEICLMSIWLYRHDYWGFSFLKILFWSHLLPRLKIHIILLSFHGWLFTCFIRCSLLALPAFLCLWILAYTKFSYLYFHNVLFDFSNIKGWELVQVSLFSQCFVRIWYDVLLRNYILRLFKD